MNEELKALALAYAAALVRYHEWVSSERSPHAMDRVKFREAQEAMYLAQENLNFACKAEAFGLN